MQNFNSNTSLNSHASFICNSPARQVDRIIAIWYKIKTENTTLKINE